MTYIDADEERARQFDDWLTTWMRDNPQKPVGEVLEVD